MQNRNVEKRRENKLEVMELLVFIFVVLIYPKPRAITTAAIGNSSIINHLQAVKLATIRHHSRDEKDSFLSNQNKTP